MEELNLFNFRKFLTHRLLLLFFLPTIVTCFYPGSVVIPTALAGYLVAMIMYKYKDVWYTDDFDGKTIIKIFFFLNFYIYVRGFFNILTEYDIYALASTLFFTSFLIPSIMFLSQPDFLARIWRSFFLIGIVLSFFTYVFPPSDGIMTMGFNMSFIDVFLLCIPFIKKRYAVIFLALTAIVIFLSPDERSIALGMLIPILIVALWIFIKNKLSLRVIYCIAVVLPIFLLLLAIVFNINILEIIGGTETPTEESGKGMFVDSRTLVYTDVIAGLYEKNSLIWGLGGNGKVHSYLMDISWYDFDTVYKGGRGGTESGMFNYILYSGFIGMVIYGLYLLKASYLALFQSKNQFMKMLGLFIAFKYVYSFIDDRIAFTCHNLYMFLWIGMCFNRSFRRMDDYEIKKYFSTIFR